MPKQEITHKHDVSRVDPPTLSNSMLVMLIVTLRTYIAAYTLLLTRLLPPPLLRDQGTEGKDQDCAGYCA